MPHLIRLTPDNAIRYIGYDIYYQLTNNNLVISHRGKLKRNHTYNYNVAIINNLFFVFVKSNEIRRSLKFCE